MPDIEGIESSNIESLPEVERLDSIRCVKIPADVRDAFLRRAVDRAGRAVLAAAVAKAQSACAETTVALQNRVGDPDALVEAVVGPSLRLLALERAIATYPVEPAPPVVVLSELCTEAVGRLSAAVPADVPEPMFSRAMAQWRRAHNPAVPVGAGMQPIRRPVSDPPRALETDYAAEDAYRLANEELRSFRDLVRELQSQSADAGKGWESAVGLLSAADDALDRVPELRDRVENCREIVAKADQRRDQMMTGSAR